MTEDTLFGPQEYIEKPPEFKSNATPAPRGSGPDGETCKTCNSSIRIGYHNKYYWKCNLKSPWTHGAGSDIRLKWDACRCFVSRET